MGLTASGLDAALPVYARRRREARPERESTALRMYRKARPSAFFFPVSGPRVRACVGDMDMDKRQRR